MKRSIEASRSPLFRVPPFPAFPNASRYVPVGPMQEALNRVVRSVEAHEGIALVIGPPGTGKTLLGQLLAQHFAMARKVVQMGESALATSETFLRHLLHALEVDLKDLPASDLHLALIDYLRHGSDPRGGLLILVDEAQALEEDVLEAIRMATNIMLDGQPCVSAVLTGGPKLDETLALPSLDSFVQRVATRCYLHPLHAEESHGYIHDAIRKCGGTPQETITDDAVHSVHQATGGVPRLINQLMTQAIDTAEAHQKTMIDELVIDHAWATLQQLPSPILEEPTLASISSEVEFGPLEETTGDTFHWTPDDQPVAPEAGENEACEPATCEQEGCQEGHCQEASAGQNHLQEPMDPEVTLPHQEVANTVEINLELEFECEAGCTSGCDVPDHVVSNVMTALDTCAQSSSNPSQVANTSSIVAGAVIIRDAMSALAFEESEQPAADSTEITTEALPSLEGLRMETPESDELFGEFEQEEDLSIGRPSSATSLSMESDNNVDDEPETSIQQEVASIAMDMDAIRPDETEDDASDFRLAPELEISGQPPLKVVDAPQDSILWTTEASETEHVRDDTDLLVIEDDLSVEHQVSNTIRADQGAETLESGDVVSVDFQAMLAKMRGGV